MTEASHAAYQAILPKLGRREQDILEVMLSYGPLTNKQIGNILTLDRDSVSPRTASLRKKGLLLEAGMDGTETLYSLSPAPVLQKPKPVRPKAYREAVKDIRTRIFQMIHDNRFDGLIFKEREQVLQEVMNYTDELLA